MANLLLGWEPDYNKEGVRVFPRKSWEKNSPNFNSCVKHKGEGHLITFAPTGAGKGVGVILPNLLHYNGPVITIDPKGENFVITARYRKEVLGQKIYLLDPFNSVEDSHIERLGIDRARLDPLDLVDEAGLERDVQLTMLASVVTNQSSDPNTDRKNDFWENEAMKLLAGVFGAAGLDIFVTGKKTDGKYELESWDKCYEKVIEYMYCDDVVYRLAVVLDDVGDRLSTFAYKCIATFLQKADKERSGVMSTAQSHMNPLAAPLVLKSLTNSTISLDEVANSDNFTVYIVIPPSKLVSHSILLRLWIAVFLHTIMSRSSAPSKRTLFLLDECAQLGYLDGLKKAITLLRGYGLQVWMFFQDLTQLESIYGLDYDGMINNCSVMQTFGFSRQLAAEPIANIIGDYTADQLMRLPKGQQIISTGSGKARIIQSLRYYSDAAFAGRWDRNPMFSTPESEHRKQGFTSNILKL